MTSNPRRQHGKLSKMTPEARKKRAEKRKRKGTWAVRVWANRHIKEDVKHKP